MDMYVDLVVFFAGIYVGREDFIISCQFLKFDVEIDLLVDFMSSMYCV